MRHKLYRIVLNKGINNKNYNFDNLNTNVYTYIYNIYIYIYNYIYTYIHTYINRPTCP